MLKALVMIGLGGALGSIARYLTSIFISKYFQHHFPVATFIVNVAGCLLIGLCIGFFNRQQQLPYTYLKFLLITGFCGGYTTFSAFSAENIALLQAGNVTTAFVYITASILACLTAVWFGLLITK